jgi:deoxycytidylate deaminase
MASTKFSVTAIIYDKRGRVLSIGKNHYLKSHPIQGYHAEKVGLPEKIYLHAEISAIVKCQDLSKAHTIVVTRVSKQGKFRMAKPCPVCQSALKNTPIKKILYSVNDVEEREELDVKEIKELPVVR